MQTVFVENLFVVVEISFKLINVYMDILDLPAVPMLRKVELI